MNKCTSASFSSEVLTFTMKEELAMCRCGSKVLEVIENPTRLGMVGYISFLQFVFYVKYLNVTEYSCIMPALCLVLVSLDFSFYQADKTGVSGNIRTQNKAEKKSRARASLVASG